MSFTFVQVEQRKTRVIGWVFAFIVLIYFLTAYLILGILQNAFLPRFSPEETGRVVWPAAQHAGVAFLIALAIGFFHWSVSVSNLIPKMLLAVGGIPTDAKDIYHQVLRNIADEVSVAIGGRKIETVVIPTAAANAFALEDFEGRAVIGVTEGLLTRLNRAQLEAVVGHEAGHIINGDCLSTTITSSLAEIYDEGTTRLAQASRRVRGRGGALILLLFLVVGLMKFISSLVRYFVSRQKEYRADATAVRLTRDPLSLAEALKLISGHWRGGGAAGERLESIFIIAPTPHAIDESRGVLADMFSTHPPIRDRVQVLLEMAHLDEAGLEERLKKPTYVSPVVQPFSRAAGPATTVRRWSVFADQKWQGPMTFDEVKRFQAFAPEIWVKREDEETVRHAYEDPDLSVILTGTRPEGAEETKQACPSCRIPLVEARYEGVPARVCDRCEGVFVEGSGVSRILIREDMVFSPEVVKRAEGMFVQREAFQMGGARTRIENSWAFSCPACNEKMRRQFFVDSYPVEVDKCLACGGFWFDKGELEILQYIYQNRDKYFGGG